MKTGLVTHIVAAALAVGCANASAVDFSFSGMFTGDDDVQLFDFSVGMASRVTFRTLSYAGGTNAAGTVIARGGFDPILALFDSRGLLINQNDDGGFRVPGDPVTGAHWDTYLRSVLEPGTYTVSVMQYANFALGPTLSSGFLGAHTHDFRDNTGTLRDGHWAFDILNVNSAVAAVAASSITVPEPETYALMAVGLAGIALMRRRRKVIAPPPTSPESAGARTAPCTPRSARPRASCSAGSCLRA